MQFDNATNLDRKSGFGRHQLRNRYIAQPSAVGMHKKSRRGGMSVVG
jgi:hypothetical protein